MPGGPIGGRIIIAPGGPNLGGIPCPGGGPLIIGGFYAVIMAFSITKIKIQ